MNPRRLKFVCGLRVSVLLKLLPRPPRTNRTNDAILSLKFLLQSERELLSAYRPLMDRRTNVTEWSHLSSAPSFTLTPGFLFLVLLQPTAVFFSAD